MRAALEGEYTSLAGRVRVLRHGEGLRAEALGQTFDLLPLADGSVRIRLRLFGLLPWSLGELDRLTLKLVPVDGRELLVGRIGRQTMGWHCSGGRQSARAATGRIRLRGTHHGGGGAGPAGGALAPAGGG